MPHKIRLTYDEFVTLNEKEKVLLTHLTELIEAKRYAKAIEAVQGTRPRVILRLSLISESIRAFCQRPDPELISYWNRFVHDSPIRVIPDHSARHSYTMKPQPSFPPFDQAMSLLCHVQYLELEKKKPDIHRSTCLDEDRKEWLKYDLLSNQWLTRGLQYGSFHAGLYREGSVMRWICIALQRTDWTGYEPKSEEGRWFQQFLSLKETLEGTSFDILSKIKTDFTQLIEARFKIALYHGTPGYILLNKLFLSLGNLTKKVFQAGNAADGHDLYLSALECMYRAQFLNRYSTAAAANAYFSDAHEHTEDFTGFLKLSDGIISTKMLGRITHLEECAAQLRTFLYFYALQEASFVQSVAVEWIKMAYLLNLSPHSPSALFPPDEKRPPAPDLMQISPDSFESSSVSGSDHSSPDSRVLSPPLLEHDPSLLSPGPNTPCTSGASRLTRSPPSFTARQ